MTHRLQVLASSAATLAFALFGIVHLMTDSARTYAATSIAPTYGQAMLMGTEEAF